MTLYSFHSLLIPSHELVCQLGVMFLQVEKWFQEMLKLAIFILLAR
jgi:hypothetical protein